MSSMLQQFRVVSLWIDAVGYSVELDIGVSWVEFRIRVGFGV